MSVALSDISSARVMSRGAGAQSANDAVGPAGCCSRVSAWAVDPAVAPSVECPELEGTFAGDHLAVVALRLLLVGIGQQRERGR